MPDDHTSPGTDGLPRPLTALGPGPQGEPSVIVVGGGIVGLATAAWLSRSGCPVVVLERRGPGEMTSFGNAGGLSSSSATPLAMPGMVRKVPGWLTKDDGPLRIRPAHALAVTPWLLRFLKETREARVRANSAALYALNRHSVSDLMPLVRDAGIEDLVVVPGNLTLYRNRAAFDAGQLTNELREATGHAYEVLDTAALREAEPELSPDFGAAVRSPDNGYVKDPYLVSRGLARHLEARGVQILNREVQGVEIEGRRITGVQTDRGLFTADRVVIAAGVWSKQILAKLGHRVALESQRGYHVSVKEPNVRLNNILAVGDRKISITPMVSGLRVSGTVEFSGTESMPDRRRGLALLPALKSVLPRLEIGETTEWSGHRPCTPDSLPVIGTSPRFENLLFGFGHGHQGLIGAGPTGRILRDTILGREPGLDLAPYRVERFAGVV